MRTELRPRGLEIVTVALDTDVEAARPWIEAAKPEHPALVDREHALDVLFGIVNVPSGVWIDERGVIVRPPEPAWPRRPVFLDREISPDLPERRREAVLEARKLRVDAERYVAALRDWVDRGAESPYALPPDEVTRRSRPRPIEEAVAAAHFELAQHLHRIGRADAAIAHFREAQALAPYNWTYKRQAWALGGPEHLRVYGTDWLGEVRRIGAENYYPPLDL